MSSTTKYRMVLRTHKNYRGALAKELKHIGVSCSKVEIFGMKTLPNPLLTNSRPRRLDFLWFSAGNTQSVPSFVSHFP